MSLPQNTYSELFFAHPNATQYLSNTLGSELYNTIKHMLQNPTDTTTINNMINSLNSGYDNTETQTGEQPYHLCNKVDEIENITSKCVKSIWSNHLAKLLNVHNIAGDDNTDLDNLLLQLSSNNNNKSLQVVNEQFEHEHSKIKTKYEDMIHLTNQIKNKSYNDLDQLLNDNESLIENIFSGNSGELKTYLSLQHKYTNQYNDVLGKLNKTRDMLLNSFNAMKYLNKNLSLSTNDANYQEQINNCIQSLNIDKLIYNWLEYKCKLEMFQSFIKSPIFELKCMICNIKTNDNNHLQLLDPCGHLLCSECNNSIQDHKCPYCRKYFTKGIRIY